MFYKKITFQDFLILIYLSLIKIIKIKKHDFVNTK